MYTECLQVEADINDRDAANYDIVNIEEQFNVCKEWYPDVDLLDEDMHQHEIDSQKELRKRLDDMRNKANHHVDINSIGRSSLVRVKSSRPEAPTRSSSRSPIKHSEAYKRRFSKQMANQQNYHTGPTRSAAQTQADTLKDKFSKFLQQ